MGTVPIFVSAKMGLSPLAFPTQLLDCGTKDQNPQGGPADDLAIVRHRNATRLAAAGTAAQTGSPHWDGRCTTTPAEAKNYSRSRAIFLAFSLIQGSSAVFFLLSLSNSVLERICRAGSARSFRRSPSSWFLHALQPESPNAQTRIRPSHQHPSRGFL
jgi:hypothetical protein